jgi:predicted HicB family RNase H-like nuclease
MGNIMSYKGFFGNIEICEESNMLHGKLLGLNNDLVVYEGDSVLTLRKDFQDAVEEYIDHCAEIGKIPENYKGDATQLCAKLSEYYEHLSDSLRNPA